MVYLKSVVPILEVLENRIIKFKNLFGRYTPALTAKTLKQEILMGQNAYNSDISFLYKLEKFLSSDYSYDIHIEVHITFEINKYQIYCDIKQHHNITTRIYFDENKYSTSANQKAIDIFCSEISRDIISIVKSYQKMKEYLDGL